jgi:membrane-bound lytic murein transglycosylase D
VSVYRLSDMNLAWRRAVLDRGAKIPSGSTIWLPAGTTRRVASQPAPEPVLVARVEPKPAPKVAAAAAKPAPRPAAAVVKTHVVKPNETLYRVALRYDMSVDELKRLNRIKDDTIRAGQRLRVGGSS